MLKKKSRKGARRGNGADNGQLHIQYPLEVLDAYALRVIRHKAWKLAFKPPFNASDFEDIQQELALQLMMRAPLWNPTKGQWSTFLTRVVNNQASKLLEMRRAGCRHTSQPDESIEAILEGHPTASASESDFVCHSTSRDDLRADLRRAIASLPPELQTICRLLQENTASDTAAILKISRRTLFRHTCTIRQALLEAGLGEYLPENHPLNPRRNPMSDVMITTYSMWRLFRDCRRACQLRYLDHLVPLQRSKCLSFGSVIHDCLEKWHLGVSLETVLRHIDAAFPERMSDDDQRKDWHLARAMMTGYAARYPEEDFKVLALEKPFQGPIVNPASGAVSRTFTLAGKVDGIVKQDGQFFLLEHKTASGIDGSYLERLWTDFQITLYTWYVEETLRIPVAGIIYNILAKAKLQQGKGETEQEFEARRAELLAKSKTGKSSAKRKMPESDEDFQARLVEKYRDPEMFHRELLYLSREQYEPLRAELWELTQSFLDARRRGVFYQNTSFCFHYNRPCPYFPLCASNNNPIVRENFYETQDPHEELRCPEQNEPLQPF